MNFPKKIMRKNELVREMGMSERKLEAIYRTRGQTVAKKLNPGVRNSPIIFDTDRLAEYLDREQQAENKAIQRGGIPCVGGM